MHVNRIWIELDKPTGNQHAEHQVRLANLMLARLEIHPGFGWDKKAQKYFYGSTVGGYFNLEDRGHWFNLDYASGE